jgi:hypothetical protein
VVREAGLELLEDKQFQAGETVMSPTSYRGDEETQWPGHPH